MPSPTSGVTGDDGTAVEDLRPLDDPDREAREIDLVGGHRPRVLGRLAAEQRAPGLAAALGDARDHEATSTGSSRPTAT